MRLKSLLGFVFFVVNSSHLLLFFVLVELKMACGRIQIASNKKSALLKQSMREVALLLAEDPPREEKAKIRAEALIRDDNMIEAYEILQLECELLHERIKLIQYSKTCPQDLVSVISTLIWASHRVDFEELNLIRKQFSAKYGKVFVEHAMRNVGGVLNERVVSKLSIEPPAAYLVQTYLERICEQFQVDWTPSIKLTADDLVEPMVRSVCPAKHCPHLTFWNRLPQAGIRCLSPKEPDLDHRILDPLLQHQIIRLPQERMIQVFRFRPWLRVFRWPFPLLLPSKQTCLTNQKYLYQVEPKNQLKRMTMTMKTVNMETMP